MGSKTICECEYGDLPSTFEERNEAFYKIRSECTVLRELIIPASILEKHQNFTRSPLDKANYISAPRLAFERGELCSFCEPMHKFVVSGHNSHPSLTKQYKNDLQETWLLETFDDNRRFEQSRRFKSRFMELVFALWLEASGWTTLGIEALGNAFDYTGLDSTKRVTDFEIKYIPQSEAAYELNLEALNDESGVSVGCLDLYGPVNYLLLRAANAAKQLRKSKNRKVICLIADEYPLFLKIPLSDNPPWINWSCPTFMHYSNAIDPLLARERSKDPDFDQNMVKDITSLDEIWVMSPVDRYQLKLMHIFTPTS